MVEFDAVCPSNGPEPPSEQLASTDAHLILFIDLNYLDARMRHDVADAIDQLAGRVMRGGIRAKVIIYTRRLEPLTHDFTADPSELRAAARDLRQIAEVGLRTYGLGRTPSSALEPGKADARSMEERSNNPPTSLTKQGATNFPAFGIEPITPESLHDRFLEQLDLSRSFADLANLRSDPRASLAAIESVLIAHSALRGRKALLLFSSAAFELDEELWLNYVRGPRQAAQGGFTIWSVDARGLAGRVSGTTDSRLLGYLANSTGGEMITLAGRLEMAFERALAQLSCYYLFSIPVKAPTARPQEHFVDVRLDTAKYPKFWRYRVRSVGNYTLHDPTTLRTMRRLAALMAPQDYRVPEVRLSASYPTGVDPMVTSIEVATLLSDLSFERLPTGQGLTARFGWEGLLLDSTGKTLCTFGDGVERVVRSEQMPLRYPPAMLVLRAACRLPGPGRYELRSVIEDMSTGDVGATTASLTVSRAGTGVAAISALRLGRNSGRDFLLATGDKRVVEVPRDDRRRSFVPVTADEVIDRQDRIIVRFVSCNPNAGTPHVVVFVPGEMPKALFQVALERHAEQSGEGVICREFEGVIPENVLSAGEYSLALLQPNVDVKSRDDLEQALRAGDAISKIGFRVQGAVTAPPKSDRPQAALSPPLRQVSASESPARYAE